MSVEVVTNPPDLARALRLYVLTPDRPWSERDMAAQVDQAIAGGATAVQLRGKALEGKALWSLGTRLALACKRAGVLFIVNDRVDVAIGCGADGVHLGPADLPVAVARRIGGDSFIIGASVGTVDEALRAQSDGADYLGAGSVFSTISKADADAPIGCKGLAAIVQASRLPVVGIGGITADHAADVLAAGARGVAVIGAVFGMLPVEQAAAHLRQVVDAALGGGTHDQ